MDRDWTPVIAPLGMRLQRVAERIARAKKPRLAWLSEAKAVLERIAALPTAGDGRFQRVETSHLLRTDAPDLRLAELTDTPTGDEPEGLPAHVRDRLKPHVGPAAEMMRVHHGEEAHRVAARYRADAVVFGPHVYFGRGRYRPDEEKGFALLAHEATHVSQSTRPNAGWRGATAADVAAEEALAIAVERSVRERRPRLHAQWDRASENHEMRPPTDRGSTPATPPESPAARPMTASTERPLDAAASSAPSLDLDGLRRSLTRDLMSQIRADLERGG